MFEPIHPFLYYYVGVVIWSYFVVKFILISYSCRKNLYWVFIYSALAIGVARKKSFRSQLRNLVPCLAYEITLFRVIFLLIIKQQGHQCLDRMSTYLHLKLTLSYMVLISMVCSYIKNLHRLSSGLKVSLWSGWIQLYLSILLYDYFLVLTGPIHCSLLCAK